MASTYLTETNTTSGTRTKWTVSFWVKRGNISGENVMFGSYLDGSNKDQILFISTNELQISSYQAGSYSNGGRLLTNRKFRDTNAWYHIVLRWDTGNATANDRMKMWVNGVEETSFQSRDNPTQNRESLININGLTTIGALNSGSYFDGSISHIHFCDGYAYSASDFGETDANGVWKIKTSPSVSYGTKGYFILKNGNSVTDQSGNGNNWTVAGGTLTNTEDNPSNVFATLNPLASSNITISFGNTSAYKAGAGWNNVSSTLGASTGKYYAECKVNGVGSNGVGIGFVNLDKSNLQNLSLQGGEDNFSAGIYSNSGAIFYSSGTTWKTVGALSNGDIVQLAMDLDNGFLYWGKNGTWFDSANPESGATGTGGLAISNLTSGGTYAFNTSVRNGGDVRWNYGNGYFGTTAVASAGTNASGIGIFEYNVPSGYTALSTKGLNL